MTEVERLRETLMDLGGGTMPHFGCTLGPEGHKDPEATAKAIRESLERLMRGEFEVVGGIGDLDD
jgi:hypothetical protein